MKRWILVAIYCPLEWLAWWFDFLAKMAYEPLYRENTRLGELKRRPVFNHERDCGLTNDAGTCECSQSQRTGDAK